LGDWDIHHRNNKSLWQTNQNARGSGGLTAQFRERPGRMNKMLKAQGGSPFQSSGRSHNDDAISGLETMTAFGNFFQDPI